MESLAIIVAATFGVVLVHEMGHYAFAVLFARLPPKAVKIVVTSWPPYVALRDGQNWLSPDDQRYQTVFRSISPSMSMARWFIASGYVAQILGVLGWVLISRAVGGWMAAMDQTVVMTSGVITLIVSLLELSNLVFTGRVSGDLSALWSAGRIPAGLLIAWVTFGHVLAFMLAGSI